MNNAIEIAKYIISKCVTDQKPISNLQLQGILYCVQKEFLRREEIAFEDDFEAWVCGAVIPKVYYRFCGFGAMPITSRYDVDIDEEIKQIIDDVIKVNRGRNPWDLVADTRRLGGVWEQVYKDGAGYKEVIAKGLIKEERF